MRTELGPVFCDFVGFQASVSPMAWAVKLYAFWRVMRKILSRERRLRRGLGRQAEGHEKEQGEYRLRESSQSDLNSLIAIVVRFVRTFERHSQILGLPRS